MSFYTANMIIDGMTFSTQDELNYKFRDLFYEFLLYTGDFATSGTQNATTGEITSGTHIIQKDSVTGNKLIIDNVNFTIENTYNISKNTGSLTITNDSTGIKSTMALNTFLNNYSYVTESVGYSITTTDKITLIYRGYNANSFFLNVTVEGNDRQNMRFFEFLKLYAPTIEEYVVGLRTITVTANSFHVNGNTSLNGIVSCVDESSLADRGFTLTASTMPAYVSKYYAGEQLNKYDCNYLMRQRYTGDYCFDSGIIVGCTLYYKQYNVYKISGGIYYCFTNGYLLRMG